MRKLCVHLYDSNLFHDIWCYFLASEGGSEFFKSFFDIAVSNNNISALLILISHPDWKKDVRQLEHQRNSIHKPKVPPVFREFVPFNQERLLAVLSDISVDVNECYHQVGTSSNYLMPI